MFFPVTETISALNANRLPKKIGRGLPVAVPNNPVKFFLNK